MRRALSNLIWWQDNQPTDLIIEGGRVVARGPNVAHNLDPGTVEDCQGKILVPGFVDNHCHILPTGLDLLKLDLRPFDTKDDVLEAISARETILPPGEWLLAVGYDQTRFPDNAHLTRLELDRISGQRPLLLRHVSGHASVANSAALVAANIDSSTTDPQGGTFERDQSGQLTGVLLEAAHERVTAAAPKVTFAQMVEAIVLAAEHMAAFGISCAADMMTGRFHLEEELNAYMEAARRGTPVRFRLYLQWKDVFGPRALAPGRLKELSESMTIEQCKVAGIKIFADGAIGARTAAIYGQYANSMGASDEGTLMYPPERLKEMVRVADSAGYQVAVHAIGDRATDLVLDAFEESGHADRHRLEHAMILSDAQIERVASLNPFVSMQPEFLHRFGHTYRKQLGTDRAGKLKRFRSVKNSGVRLSLSSDRPIVLGDPKIGLAMATSRPHGFDQDENLTDEEAVLGYTSHGADALGDESLFGELKTGQFADFQLIEASDWHRKP